MLDKLRVCIICNYYSLNGRLNLNDYINHPAIKELKCEYLDLAISHIKSQQQHQHSLSCTQSQTNNTIKLNSEEFLGDSMSQTPSIDYHKQYFQQFDVKIFVGNVSKYFNNNSNNNNLNKKSNSTTNSTNNEPSQYDQDLITHKWMIYIRSPNCLKLESYIKKVIFYLHSSYKPYDMVEVK